jgi:DNA primase
MDYNMNVRGKTLNVAYSPGGRARAPVSMPLTWEELAGAHPLDFTITNAPERLAPDGTTAGRTRWSASKASSARLAATTDSAAAEPCAQQGAAEDARSEAEKPTAKYSCITNR